MTDALRSCATRWASLYSDPSSCWLEKGMSYGSTQTRSSERGRRGALAMSATAAAVTSSAPVNLTALRCIGLPAEVSHDTTPGAGARSLRHRGPCASLYGDWCYRSPGLQPEHEQRAARIADVDVVTEGTDRAQRGGRILGADAERHTGARPAAHSGEHGDVLLAIGSEIRHRVPDDARRALELPQQRAGRRVDGLEPAFHRAIEHDAARGRQRAAIRGQVLLDLPLDLPDGRIPRDEAAAVTARAGEHAHDRADVGLSRRVLHFHALVVHADVVDGDVEELGLRRVSGRLLILEADRGGADTLGVLLRGGPELRIANRDARRQVDLRRPVDRPEGLGHEHLAVRPIERVAEAVAVEVHQRLHRLRADRQVDEDVLVDAVIVPLVVRRHLVRPLHFAVVRITGEDRHRPLVVAGPLIRVPRPRVARAVVEQVQLRIVGVPAPRGAAAVLPLVALPGADAEVLAAHRRVVGIGVADDLHFRVGPGRIAAPHFLAGVHVVRGHPAAYAELTTRDPRDH